MYETLEKTAERFNHGTEYLNEWRRDSAVREEFEEDFSAYCHYRQAKSAGLVKSFGGKR